MKMKPTLPADRQAFHFLRMGWWLVHFMGITLIYALGHIIWR